MAEPSPVAVTPLDETAELLLSLAEAMHGVQVPADLIEARLLPIAERLGVRIDLALQQTYVAVEVGSHDGRRGALRRTDFDAHWRLARVRDLSLLTCQLADGKISTEDARARVRQLVAEPPRYPQLLVVIAYAVYSVAVAARVGGGVPELAAATLIGLIAGAIHYGTIRYRAVDLQKSFLAGLVGSVAALACARFVGPFDLVRSLFGGVTLLIPAMVLVIATHELAAGALESGVARLSHGLLRFMMLGAGIGGAFRLWARLAPLPPMPDATPLPTIVVLALLIAGAAALVVCLQGRPADAAPILLGVVVGYGAMALSKQVFGEEGAPFVAAFAVGAAGAGWSRTDRRHLAAPVLVAGLLQIAPGFLGTQTVVALLRGEQGHESFFQVIVVAVQLTTGLILASVLFAVHRPKQHRGGWGGD